MYAILHAQAALGLLILFSVLVLVKPSNRMSMGGSPWYREQKITSGLSMDPLYGDDYDLIPWLQSNRVGKDCNNCKNRYDEEEDDGCRCDRDCSKYPEPRICYWRFVVEQYGAMGPACRNCSTGNTSNCYDHQCVVGDGREKTIFIINRMTPGPTVSVCKGDLLVFDVINLMTSQGVTIHWHGMLQETTPYMDGAPYVNQCPIPPNGQFRYKFPALTEGTHWYHSHLGNTQRDGLNGAICVKVPRNQEPKFCDYDYDLPCHIFNINDWQQYLFDYQFPGYYKNASHVPIKSESYIINGFGSFNDNTTRTRTPHAEFHVKCGKKYRMRIISSSSITCTYQFSIENHDLKIIAFDGSFIEPVIVKTIVMAPGMRTDFILDANRCDRYQKGSGKCSYYITVKGLDLCTNRTLPQTGYLVYDCCKPEPINALNLTSAFQAPYLDYVQQGCNRSDVICSYECRSPEKPLDPRLVYGGKCEHRVFWNITSHRFSYNELFNNSETPYQSWYEPAGGLTNPTPAITELLNNISPMLAPTPLLTSKFPIPDNMLCYNKCNANGTFCTCINIAPFAYNSCVEFVILDNIAANHPFHIHGHKWYVLKMGSPEERQKPNFWLNIDKTQYPPRRDTTIVPSLGFTVLRFIADNPGYWMFHCHFQNHMMGGMWAVIKVGERNQFVKTPRGFPKCDPYLPRVTEVSQYSRKCKAKDCAFKKYRSQSSETMCPKTPNSNSYPRGSSAQSQSQMSQTQSQSFAG